MEIIEIGFGSNSELFLFRFLLMVLPSVKREQNCDMIVAGSFYQTYTHTYSTNRRQNMQNGFICDFYCRVRVPRYAHTRKSIDKYENLDIAFCFELNE